MSEKQAAALHNELDQLEMQTLGALASSGPATAGVLKGSEVATNRSGSGCGQQRGRRCWNRRSETRFRGAARFGRAWVVLWLESVPAAHHRHRRHWHGRQSRRSEGERQRRWSERQRWNRRATRHAWWLGCARVSAHAISEAWRKTPDAAGNITLTIRVGAGGEVTASVVLPAHCRRPSWPASKPAPSGAVRCARGWQRGHFRTGHIRQAVAVAESAR